MIQSGLIILLNGVFITLMGALCLEFEKMAPTRFGGIMGWAFVVLGIGFTGVGVWATGVGVFG